MRKESFRASFTVKQNLCFDYQKINVEVRHLFKITMMGESPWAVMQYS